MRLVTRSDFDGLVSAVLLKEKKMIDDIQFVHPKDIQDGKIDIDSNDILVNIPYSKGCGYWFDHHTRKEERNTIGDFKGISNPFAPSAAQVVYEYYKGYEGFKDDHIHELIQATNKANSAQFTIQEILNPTDWVLISFITDPRAGLGRYHDYRISNYNLMMDMVDYLREKKAHEILTIPDVKERMDRFLEQESNFKAMLKKCTTTKNNVIIIDLRDEKEIFTGNRFLVYSLFPEQNISIQIMWKVQRQNIVLACGYSIINKTATADIGRIMFKYGGGGHKKAGTCQIPVERAVRTIDEIIKAFTTK